MNKSDTENVKIVLDLVLGEYLMTMIEGDEVTAQVRHEFLDGLRHIAKTAGVNLKQIAEEQPYADLLRAEFPQLFQEGPDVVEQLFGELIVGDKGWRKFMTHTLKTEDARIAMRRIADALKLLVHAGELSQSEDIVQTLQELGDLITGVWYENLREGEPQPR